MAVVTVAALLAAVVSALVLLRRFHPDLQVTGDLAAVDDHRRYAPRAWVQLHELSLTVAVVAALSWAVLTAVVVRGRSRPPTVVVMVAAGVAVVGCLVASASWGLVRWDQLALWAVGGPPSDHRGLWGPAFSDEVRFVIVRGAEVEQSTYRLRLLVHVIAPVLAAAALIVAVRARRQRSRPAEATALT
jgi:hypothetical protein